MDVVFTVYSTIDVHVTKKQMNAATCASFVLMFDNRADRSAVVFGQKMTVEVCQLEK